MHHILRGIENGEYSCTCTSHEECNTLHVLSIVVPSYDGTVCASLCQSCMITLSAWWYEEAYPYQQKLLRDALCVLPRLADKFRRLPVGGFARPN